MPLGPAWINAAADVIDQQVAQVVSTTIGIDMHNHVYPAGTEPHPGPRQAEDVQQRGAELLLAPEITRSGLTAVCASFVLDFTQTNKPGDARDNYPRWLATIEL